MCNILRVKLNGLLSLRALNEDGCLLAKRVNTASSLINQKFTGQISFFCKEKCTRRVVEWKGKNKIFRIGKLCQ